MAERVNLPPVVRFPQRNPFPNGSPAHFFVRELIDANRQQSIIIEQLWRRVGGGTDTVAETQIRESYGWDTLEAPEETFDYGFDAGGTEESGFVYSMPDEPEEWLNVKASTQTTVVNRQVVMASNSASITLNAPNIDDDIIVINEDDTRITVSGGGNNIKVRRALTDSISWSTAGKSVRFLWFQDGPYWVAI